MDQVRVVMGRIVRVVVGPAIVRVVVNLGIPDEGMRRGGSRGMALRVRDHEAAERHHRREAGDTEGFVEELHFVSY